jgi:valyl-tRNA synthetase
MAKPRLQDAAQRPTAQRILAHVLDGVVRLLHPMTPFLTEEIWQLLGQACPERGLEEPILAAESVMIAPWPEADDSKYDARVESQFALFQKVVRGIRDIRHQQNIPQRSEVSFVLRADRESTALLEPLRAHFPVLAGAKATSLGPGIAPPPLSASFVDAGLEVYVDLAGLIDVAAEVSRQEKDLIKLKEMIQAKEKKLANENFTSRAPADVVEKERASLAELQARRESIQAGIAELRKQK